MASAAQVLANRLNAEKSTGPRTPEGKAVVSQNAVQHGLLAQQVVIKGEDPGEFDSFRDGMLEELAPEGAVEALLAERLVGLSWRLRRAERLQATVFDAVYRENAEGPIWPPRELRVQPKPDDGELILGQVVMTDFARARVLDRLLVYERRIENSLYRTMAELRKHKKLRETDTPTREPTADKDESVKCEVSSWKQEVLGSGSELPTSNLKLQTSEETSDDATTNAASAVETSHHSHIPIFQDSSPQATVPVMGEPSCETNPIVPGSATGDVTASAPAGTSPAVEVLHDSRIPSFQDASPRWDRPPRTDPAKQSQSPQPGRA